MTQLSLSLDFEPVEKLPAKEPRVLATEPVRYWIGAASREHVGMGIVGGF